MKKVIIISLFVLGLIIPNIYVKAVDVSNEEELRAAIEQGGDITLTQNIEVTQPLVIDKDVNIDGGYHSIMMQGDNTLITVNSGKITLDVGLYAGWNGKYDEYDDLENVVKGQGTGLVVNGGNVNIDYADINAGKLGIEVNNGIITGWADISAGEYNVDNEAYSGGQGMIVNGGSVNVDYLTISSGKTSLIVNNDANVTFDGYIASGEENGIEANGGLVVSNQILNIYGYKNAIYSNGGNVKLNGQVVLETSGEGKDIYINKGVCSKTGGEILNLGKNFIFGYEEGTMPNFSIYINPNIRELWVVSEKNIISYERSKLLMNFTDSNNSLPSITTGNIETRDTIPFVLYYGTIESNELGKCTVVYINGVKQNEVDPSCNPVTDNKNEPSQIVNVPATSAYASIIIITLGILCVIVSVIVTRKVTKKS